MNKLQNFYNRLEGLKKPRPDDPYDNRVTHCYLLYKVEDIEHKIEVRGWGSIENGELKVYIVSWSLCAGTGMLTLNESIVDKFTIKEA